VSEDHSVGLILEMGLAGRLAGSRPGILWLAIGGRSLRGRRRVPLPSSVLS